MRCLSCSAARRTGSDALETLAVARKHGHVERAAADRRRAVLLAAQAQVAEESEPERALTLALEAHGLAPDLVPAAVIAGRLLAARGNTPRAAKILQRTWSRSPHPDIGTVYAYARIGDSPRDRLDRVKQLAALTPNSIEGPIAVAAAAIEAHQYDEARDALAPLLHGRLTQRVATLMARIEGEQHADKGRVREWLARAVHAPRDPAWTADGVVADRWAPTSPVTGALDAFRWRVPVETMDKEGEILAAKLEELVALGSPRAPAMPDEVPQEAPVTRGGAETVETIDVAPAAPSKSSPPAAALKREPDAGVAVTVPPRRLPRGRRLRRWQRLGRRCATTPRRPERHGPSVSAPQAGRLKRRSARPTGNASRAFSWRRLPPTIPDPKSVTRRT